MATRNRYRVVRSGAQPRHAGPRWAPLAWKPNNYDICIYPNGDVVKCFDHRRIPIAREPLGNIGREDIIEILCRRRATEVSRVMKTCNLPCKQMSCNKPAVLLEGAPA